MISITNFGFHEIFFWFLKQNILPLHISIIYSPFPHDARGLSRCSHSWGYDGYLTENQPCPVARIYKHLGFQILVQTLIFASTNNPSS